MFGIRPPRMIHPNLKVMFLHGTFETHIARPSFRKFRNALKFGVFGIVASLIRPCKFVDFAISENRGVCPANPTRHGILKTHYFSKLYVPPATPLGDPHLKSGSAGIWVTRHAATGQRARSLRLYRRPNPGRPSLVFVWENRPNAEK